MPSRAAPDQFSRRSAWAGSTTAAVAEGQNDEGDRPAARELPLEQGAAARHGVVPSAPDAGLRPPTIGAHRRFTISPMSDQAQTAFHPRPLRGWLYCNDARPGERTHSTVCGGRAGEKRGEDGRHSTRRLRLANLARGRAERGHRTDAVILPELARPLHGHQGARQGGCKR